MSKVFIFKCNVLIKKDIIELKNSDMSQVVKDDKLTIEVPKEYSFGKTPCPINNPFSITSINQYTPYTCGGLNDCCSDLGRYWRELSELYD